MAVRERFIGSILGVGTTSGMRFVVGNWHTSPYGSFADVFVAHADGRRQLLAPSHEVADFVQQTYTFDEVTVTDVRVVSSPRSLTVSAGRLRMHVRLGRRRTLGWLLRLVPGPLARTTRFAEAVDPLARRILPGVGTYGTAGHGRREWYGARDLIAVASLTAIWSDADLGPLSPVVPEPGFGFGSTPQQPSLTILQTTVERP